jgi:hypothetical protein
VRGYVALGLLASANLSCSIRGTGPRWIETHGHGQVQRVAGGPLGLLAIGTNGVIYNYPEFGSTWHDWSGRVHPRAIAGSGQGLIYSDQEGHVGKGNHGHVGNPEWTLSAAVTALAANEDGRELYAVSDGHVSRLLPSGPVPGPCGEVRALSIAVAQGQLWVSDGQRLYQGSESACPPAPGAPPKITRLSGLGKRLFAADEGGDVYRLKGQAWEQLPRPKKFRPDQFPKLHPVQDVAVTGTAAWVVDDEANVFVLSESE